MKVKKTFRNIAQYLPQVLVLLSVLTSNIFFPAVAIAEEIKDLPSTNTQVEEYPIDESEDILEDGISTSIYEEEEVIEEAVEPLFVYEDGIYTVFTVVEGEEYVYPDNENVRITFNEVTEDGNLVIERVELTDDQREELNTTDVYGWDISSTMSNGSFKYDLTLPNTQGNDVEVKYTEDGSNYESIEGVNVSDGIIELRGLDHFTTFVVVNPNPIGNGNESNDSDCSTVTVSGSYICYDTIQEAVTSASTGDTILVRAGTYTGAVNLQGKELTIIGDGLNNTVIDASGESGYAIKNFGDNTTIKNLKLIGSNHYGFKISHVANISLENILVVDSGKTGIDLNTVDGGTLKNIEIRDTVGGFGLMLFDSHDITVEDVTTSGNLWGGVSVHSVNRGAMSISFIGDFNASEPVQLLLEQDPPYGGGFVTIDIPDKFGYIVYGERVGPDYRQWFHFETLEDAKDYADAAVVNSPVFTYDDVLIYDIAEENYWVIEGMKIQEALAKSTSGDKIYIGAGTFIEDGQIVIDKDISIIGDNKNRTTIKPNNDTGSSGDSRGWILVEDGKEFNLKRVTLDGEGKKVYQAIRSYGSGMINNNIIKNIKHSQYTGVGIVVMGNYNMTIKNNRLENIERIGVMAFGPGVTNTKIVKNTYIGKGPGDYLDYAVEVGGGARSVIKDNDFSRCGSSTTAWESAAIMITDLYGPGTEAVIEDNHLHDNARGLHIGYGDTDNSTVSTLNNTFENNNYQIFVSSGNIDLEHALQNNYFDRAVVVRENPIKVPTIYSSIQDAIDSAVDGDIVQVLAGEYNEDLIIDIDNITIIGPNTGIPGYADERNPEALINGQILFRADGITFDGFRVNYDGTHAPIDIGTVDSPTVINNIVNGPNNSRGGIQSWGGATSGDITIGDNYVTDGPIGIYSGSHEPNIVITGNKVVNAGDEGIWMYGGNEHITLTDNIIIDAGQDNGGAADMKIMNKPLSITRVSNLDYLFGVAQKVLEVNDADTIELWDGRKYYTLSYMDFAFGSGINGEENEIGFCNVYTNDDSQAGNRAELILKFSAVEDATSYKIQGYKWNGSSWTESTLFNPEEYANNHSHASFDISDGIATYTTGATHEGIYTYRVMAYSNQGIRIGHTQRVSSFDTACKFTVDRTNPSLFIDPSRSPDIGNWYSTRPTYSNTYPTFDIFSMDTDIEKIEYKWNDGTWMEYTGVLEYKVDGKHTLYARATDLAGNVTEDQLEVWFDFSNPEGTFTINDSDGLVRQTIKLSFTGVEDPSGSEEIGRIEIWVDGYKGMATKIGDGEYEYYLDTTLLSTGEHTIRPSIFDMAGNRTRPSIKITVDNVVPIINWNNPQDSDLLSGDITLDVTCDGTSGDCNYINFWWWKEDQTIQDAIANKQYHYVHTDGTSFVWTLDSLNPEQWDGSIGDSLNGTYTLRAAGKDIAGNRTVEDISVIIDNTPPSKPTGEYWMVEGEVLSCNSYTSSYDIVAEWEDSTDDVTEVSHYEYQSFNPDDGWVWPNINYGVKVANSFRPGSFTVGEGIYGFRVRAVDMAGNKSDWSTMDFDSSCQITYDATAPVVQITNPSDTEVLSGTVDITGYVTDDNLSHYNISIYNEGVDTSNFSLRIEQNTEYTSEFTDKTLYTWDTTNGKFPDGIYQIRLAARDLAGNRELGGDSEQIIEVTVDNTPPSTILTSDPSGDFVNSPVLIEGTTEDIHGVDEVKLSYRLNGADSSDPWTDIITLNNPLNDSPFDWSHTWDPIVDGVYDIKASGTDTLGNEEQSAYIYALTYDTTPPSITLFDIVADILNVNADDLLSGTEKIEIKVDDGQWMTYTTNIDLNDLLNNEPGTYTIYIRVTDKAGNITEDSTTYTIPEPPAEDEEDVQGATDQNVVYAANLGTGAGTEIETDLNGEEENQEQVLGEEEQTCENPRKTYGYIYHDKDTDGEIDDNEDRLEDISLRIYYMENGEEMTVVTLQTDEDGYWETELCPGTYTLEVDQEDIPEDLVLGETHEILIEEDTEEYRLDLAATEDRNFWQKYWYLIVIGAGILVTITYLILSKGKKEETYN
jgi:hypothetical protein